MLGLRDGSPLAPQDFSLPGVEPTKVCCTKSGRGHPSIHKRKEEMGFSYRASNQIIAIPKHNITVTLRLVGPGHAEHFGGQRKVWFRDKGTFSSHEDNFWVSTDEAKDSKDGKRKEAEYISKLGGGSSLSAVDRNKGMLLILATKYVLQGFGRERAFPSNQKLRKQMPFSPSLLSR